MIADDLLVTVHEVRGGRVLISVSRLAAGGRLSLFEEVDRRWLVAGEVFTLGEGVSCSHLETRGERVRLGLTVPNGVTVHRKEVYDAIHDVRGDSAPDRWW
jgi:sRNA-binding carbon storage regulator CsrA